MKEMMSSVEVSFNAQPIRIFHYFIYLGSMKKHLLGLILMIGLMTSCKKSSEDYNAAAISDYAPLEVGKYIIYRLDSTVFINFGTQQVVRQYEVKYEVDAEIQDALGRPAYRIIRSIRNEATEPWQTDATFMAINTGNQFEWLENNLRFIKLSLPIRNGYHWKGNSYIDTYSPWNGLRYMDNWDYTYDMVETQEIINNVPMTTITVNQRDEIIGIPTDPQSYSEVNRSTEKYARGIGLIYKSFLHTEYQPQIGQTFGYFSDGSYGVTLTYIEHN